MPWCFYSASSASGTALQQSPFGQHNPKLVLTFRSSRLDGRGPGLIDETQVWPEKVVFTGERGVLLTEVDEEFELLTICSLDCLK